MNNDHYIDTHSHLYDASFEQDIDLVINRAVNCNVKEIILPAIDCGTNGRLFDLCRKYPDICRPLIGLHPTSVNDNPDYIKDLDNIKSILDSPPAGVGRIYGIGEIGLDFYWSRDFIREQLSCFERQLEFASQYRLPVVIHTRDAWNEMIEILTMKKELGLTGILHSYSGNYEQYKKILSCGDFYFGIGGVVTFKNSSLSDIVKQLGPDRLVLETDSPYLTPSPFRGNRNESSYIPIISTRIAEILNIKEPEIMKKTTRNAVKIFDL